jgi:hypothetical protein
MRVSPRKRKAHVPQPHYPPGTIAAYAQEYCGWLEARNYSAQTVRNRRHYLLSFAASAVRSDPILRTRIHAGVPLRVASRPDSGCSAGTARS